MPSTPSDTPADSTIKFPRYHLIGLTGPAGAGKDTFAAYLALLQTNVHVMSFAQPIRNLVDALLGSNSRQWQDRVWKEAPVAGIGKSPRELMQLLGTEWGRNMIDRDIWVNVAGGKLMDTLYSTAAPDAPRQCFVFTDVRFINEAAWIYSLGGLLVRLQRPDNPSATPHKGHVSEAGVVKFEGELVIDNSGDLNLLYEQAALLSKRLLTDPAADDTLHGYPARETGARTRMH